MKRKSSRPGQVSLFAPHAEPCYAWQHTPICQSLSGQKSLHYSTYSQTILLVAVRSPRLERRGHGEAECLARFAQEEIRPVGVDRLGIGVVPRRLVQERLRRTGEHAARNGGGRSGCGVESQRVVGPI